MCPIQLAFVVIALIALVALFTLCAPQRSTFVSGEAKAVQAATKPLYEQQGGATTYSEFKLAVAPVHKPDVALFTDTKRTFLSDPDGYTADRVQPLL
jgi:hypothetical protein